MRYLVFDLQNLSKSNKWNRVGSRIKYLLDEDRATYQHFAQKNKYGSFRRELHADDDLSEES